MSLLPVDPTFIVFDKTLVRDGDPDGPIIVRWTGHDVTLEQGFRERGAIQNDLIMMDVSRARALHAVLGELLALMPQEREDQ